MPTPDNRLRFSSTRIDFAQDVGTTGQQHDDYPPPLGQARYDHMRMVVIALLSQQSSFDAPTEYRDGTPWFDLGTQTLKIRKGDAWVPYSDAILLESSDENYKTLSQWYEEVKIALTGVSQEVVFNGICTANGVNNIRIPVELSQFIFNDTRAFVYVNGALIDPRGCTISNNIINIAHVVLDQKDEFTVVLRRIPSNSYYTQTVTIP